MSISRRLGTRPALLVAVCTVPSFPIRAPRTRGETTGRYQVPTVETHGHTTHPTVRTGQQTDREFRRPTLRHVSWRACQVPRAMTSTIQPSTLFHHSGHHIDGCTPAAHAIASAVFAVKPRPDWRSDDSGNVTPFSASHRHSEPIEPQNSFRKHGHNPGPDPNLTCGSVRLVHHANMGVVGKHSVRRPTQHIVCFAVCVSTMPVYPCCGYRPVLER